MARTRAGSGGHFPRTGRRFALVITFKAARRMQRRYNIRRRPHGRDPRRAGADPPRSRRDRRQPLQEALPGAEGHRPRLARHRGGRARLHHEQQPPQPLPAGARPLLPPGPQGDPVPDLRRDPRRVAARRELRHARQHQSAVPVEDRSPQGRRRRRSEVARRAVSRPRRARRGARPDRARRRRRPLRRTRACAGDRRAYRVTYRSFIADTVVRLSPSMRRGETNRSVWLAHLVVRLTQPVYDPTDKGGTMNATKLIPVLLVFPLAITSMACPTRPGDGDSSGGRGGSSEMDAGSGGAKATGGAAGSSAGSSGSGGAAALGGSGPGGGTGGVAGTTGGGGIGGRTGGGGTGGMPGTGGAAETCNPSCDTITQICVGTKCLLDDGQMCSVASQCASNTCTPFYLDQDGDSYGTGAAVGFCGKVAPVG